MKIESAAAGFRPITITLEEHEEAYIMLAIMSKVAGGLGGDLAAKLYKALSAAGIEVDENPYNGYLRVL